MIVALAVLFCMSNLDHSEASFFGHPRGLLILFFTEMWERFSFYGMRAILVLYIYSSIEEQGLGWSEKDAIWLYGWYTFFVYVMSIPGGIIADRVLGAKKAVMIGGFFLCVGHWIMAIANNTAFYIALILIVLGVGMLKPNISTMVGALYGERDARREKGFTLFYIGINLGALLSSIAVGLVQQYFGWHTAFGLAGFGMLLGQIFFVFGQKYLVGIGEYKGVRRDAESIWQRSILVKEIKRFFSDLMDNNAALLVALMGISISGFVFVDSSMAKGLFYAIITLCLAYFIITHGKLNMIEKNRLKVLFVVFLIIIVFNGGFEQIGGFLNIYTHEKINRTILGWEIGTGVFQGVNSAFILLLGTTVGAFWIRRRINRKEASSIFKMVIGLIITGFGYIFMCAANYEAYMEPFGKASIFWLLGFYLIITIGELCVQPVALTFITRLAPKKYTSIMMGVFFAVTGLGNKFAASIGESAHPERIVVHLDEDHQDFSIIPKESIAADSTFELHANIYMIEDSLVLNRFETGVNFSEIIEIDTHNHHLITEFLEERHVDSTNKFHAFLAFSKNVDAKRITANKGDGKDYWAKMEIEEMESKYHYEVFIFLFILIIVFGMVILLFLKKLKRLTHGAEEVKEARMKQVNTHAEVL